MLPHTHLSYVERSVRYCGEVPHVLMLDEQTLEELAQLWVEHRNYGRPARILQLPVQLVNYLLKTGRVTLAELEVLRKFVEDNKGV